VALEVPNAIRHKSQNCVINRHRRATDLYYTTLQTRVYTHETVRGGN